MNSSESSSSKINSAASGAEASAARADWAAWARSLWMPLRGLYSPGGARLRLGPAVATYSQAGSELETWARQFWYLAPLAAAGDAPPEAVALHLEGLRHGPDPEHEDYWGAPVDCDQKMVEMSAVAFALVMAPEAFLVPLTAEERERLGCWLALVNERDLQDNNWLWWRVMVQCALEKLGHPTDWAQAHRDLDRLESFDCGGGYYRDGKLDTVDYYNPWTLHFNGLLYAVWREQEDPERARRFRERALRFADRHVRWFAADGVAVPYGRSMIYRLGQASFWSALVWSGIGGDAFPHEVCKGLLLRNLRDWRRRSVFGRDGVLTLGYRYSTQFFTETYNALGSPYWGTMSLLCLALPESHAFWRAEEAPLPERDRVSVQPEAKRIYVDEAGGINVVQLTGGHDCGLNGGFDKYLKFAYSSAQGFAVGCGGEGLAEAAPDNHLLFRRPGEAWQRDRTTHRCEVDDAGIRIEWSPPIAGVRVTTRIVPQGEGHRRIHEIETETEVEVAEGGFAVEAAPESPVMAPAQTEGGDRSLRLASDEHFSKIELAEGDPRELSAEGLRTNTHLYFLRAVVPVASARLASGTHRIEARLAGGPLAAG